jgi:uncharacterized protein YbaA (DUF1428 family)
MAHYIDGFLIPIAPEKLSEYQKIAHQAGAIWMEHGALAYWECVGDDLNIEGMTSFKTAANCKDSETVIFAWILYPSREERDRINALVMADPRLQNTMSPDSDVFDCTRMAYGGFKSIVRYDQTGS